MGIETLTVQERASNGFAFLNDRGPEGWRERIDLDRLDIDHAYFCVLGQVFADNDEDVDGYEWALADFGFAGDAEELIFNGFYSLRDASDAPTLTAAWRDLISGTTEPVKAPVVQDEDQVKDDQCGYQTAYGLPWSEYCVFPKGEGMDFCPGHERDHAEQYGRCA
jgi:hypothetical protein